MRKAELIAISSICVSFGNYEGVPYTLRISLELPRGQKIYFCHF